MFGVSLGSREIWVELSLGRLAGSVLFVKLWGTLSVAYFVSLRMGVRWRVVAMMGSVVVIGVVSWCVWSSASISSESRASWLQSYSSIEQWIDGVGVTLL